MNYKAVIFDFDYTLGDATEAIVAGFTHAFAAMGLPAPEREAVRRTVGLPLEKAYTLLTGDGAEESQRRFRTLFAEVARPIQARGVPLCDGAEDLLRALARAGVAAAVVSTKNTGMLNTILGKHGLDQTLSLVIGGDMVERSKPDPEGLNAAMERLGVTAGEVLYCGDTVIDAQTARSAGTDFAAVLNGTTPAADFEPYPHVLIAESLPRLRSWLGLSDK